MLPGVSGERMPSEIDDELSRFDRMAGAVTEFVSRGTFFALCMLLIVVWAPSYFLIQNLDTWQLLINSATTIITFLLVALLQNAQHRADRATQHKLNAIATALADIMEEVDPADRASRHELREAVGLEDREGA